MTYRIKQNGFSYEVQRYGMVILDGCPDYMWKTIAKFHSEKEAQNYLAENTHEKSKHFYITAHSDPGDQFPTATSHETIEEAIDFANAHNTDTICEIGGTWSDYTRCDFCKDWFSYDEIEQDLCPACRRAIEEHNA